MENTRKSRQIEFEDKQANPKKLKTQDEKQIKTVYTKFLGKDFEVRVSNTKDKPIQKPGTDKCFIKVDSILNVSLEKGPGVDAVITAKYALWDHSLSEEDKAFKISPEKIELSECGRKGKTTTFELSNPRKPTQLFEKFSNMQLVVLWITLTSVEDESKSITVTGQYGINQNYRPFEIKRTKKETQIIFTETDSNSTNNSLKRNNSPQVNLFGLPTLCEVDEINPEAVYNQTKAWIKACKNVSLQYGEYSCYVFLDENPDGGITIIASKDREILITQLPSLYEFLPRKIRFGGEKIPATVIVFRNNSPIQRKLSFLYVSDAFMELMQAGTFDTTNIQDEEKGGSSAENGLNGGGSKEEEPHSGDPEIFAFWSSKYGQTLLHLAVITGEIGVLRYFLINRGYHKIVNIQDIFGCTALHYAVQQDREDMVKLLLQAKAAVDIPGMENLNVFQLAADLGCSKSLNILMKWEILHNEGLSKPQKSVVPHSKNPPKGPISHQIRTIGTEEADFEIRPISKELSDLFAKPIENICRIVCKVKVKEGEGSGFLIAPNIIATVHHVIPNLYAAKEATFTFFNGTETIQKQFDCNQIITNPIHDYTLISISEHLSFAFSPSLAPTTSEVRSCFLVAHNEYNIELSTYPRRIIKQYPDKIHYSGPSVKGISGSPLFNEYFQLVGIHTGSIDFNCMGFRFNEEFSSDFLKLKQRRIERSHTRGLQIRILNLLDETKKAVEDFIESDISKQIQEKAKKTKLEEIKSSEPTPTSGINPDMSSFIPKLESHYNRIQSFEFKICVTGSMKAGKSTVVKAIIGVDIAPSRSSPMTVIPTIITDTPNKVIPELFFTENFVQKFTKLLPALKDTLIKQKEWVSGDSDPEGLEKTIERIKLEESIGLNNQYTGEEVIRKQLMFVSDVVRLCVMLGISTEDIFLDFINCLKLSQNLPRVLVTFSSIVHEQETLGKISIIDMPGPDERGLSEMLKPTIDAVLRDSSAVALVIPYDTVDSSHHDDTIRKVVSANADRIYILVNKFDSFLDDWRAKKGNERKDDDSFDDTEEETDELSSDEKAAIDNLKEKLASLFPNPGIEKRIYPTSAKYAFWAASCSSWLRQREKDGTVKPKNWMHSYVQWAWGSTIPAARILKSKKERDFKEQNERLWKMSMIKEPTEDIVAASIGKLVPTLFSDALGCIETVNKKLSLTIETLQTLMEKKAESLDEIVNLVKEIRKDFDMAKRDTENMFLDKIKSLNSKLEKELTNFANGVIQNWVKSPNSESAWNWISFWPRQSDQNRLLQLCQKQFSTQEEATEEFNNTLNSISYNIKNGLQNFLKQYGEDVLTDVRTLEDDFNKKILPKLQQRSEKLGQTFKMPLFKIELDLKAPDFNLNVMENSAISTTEPISREVVKTSFQWFFYLISWKETVTENVDKYQINLSSISRIISERITESVKHVFELASSHCQSKYNQQINKYMQIFQQQIDETTKKALLLVKQTEEFKKTYKEKLQKFQLFIKDIELKCQQFKSDFELIMNQEL